MPTHGSISKAGKVRKQTPQVAPQFPNRKKPSPIRRAKKNYKLREVYKRDKIGQRHFY